MYARHLYCLMLLLVDENYIAPWDSNDPQIMKWIEDEKKKLTDSGIALAAGRLHRQAQAHLPHDRAMGGELHRHVRLRRDHDAVRIR